MKVQVWTRFSKNNFWKKVKSPLSINFGRISTSKCRGKLQKMGSCTPTHRSQEAHALATCKGLNFLFFLNHRKEF
jgi:hypothetical protein